MSSKNTDDESLSLSSAPQSAAKALLEGYNQTYIITKESNSDSKGTDGDGIEVLFRCGNWCYHGHVQFGNLKMNTVDVPSIIPTLQKQQGQLRYYCAANEVPKDSKFSAPIEFLKEASVFFASEMLTPEIEKELRTMSNLFPWIDDDSSSTYFELLLENIPDYLENISIMASKTYTCGLVVISIYCNQSIYFVLQQGEGDQPLLDVKFPNVSEHGQGVVLRSYASQQWLKLYLWHIVDGVNTKSQRIDIPKLKTFNVSSEDYVQTYCVMKSNEPNNKALSAHRDVLFRFGSWCYTGRVQLISQLTLRDVPFVIPALRVQQSRLDFFSDTSAVPTTSPFAGVLSYILKMAPVVSNQISESELSLNGLIERLSVMGLGESIRNWLDGDSNQSFFEFKIEPDAEYIRAFKNMDIIVSKSYQGSGIIIITVIFQDTMFVTLQDGSFENPLLDSKFPDVSGKGRGYQLGFFESGIEEWPTLRKVSIWQTITSLEQEFRDKVTKLAQSKDLHTESSSSTPSNQVAIASNNYPEVTPDGSKGADTRIDGANLHAESKDAQDDYNKVSPVVSPDRKITPSSTLEESRDGGASRLQMSLPHHLPKLDSLSKRLDDIRKTLGDESISAPWDSRGQPLGISSRK